MPSWRARLGKAQSGCGSYPGQPWTSATAGSQFCKLATPDAANGPPARATHSTNTITFDVKALYTYDAFSPLVLFTLERFGFCGTGEAADFVQDGRIAPGGALPVNTNGGLLSEAHIAGWNHIREMTRQLRGAAGPRQIENADVLQWAAVWGDSFILTKE